MMYFMLKQKIDEKKSLDDVEPKNTVKQRWTRLMFEMLKLIMDPRPFRVQE
jgi:hypothetical protein